MSAVRCGAACILLGIAAQGGGLIWFLHTTSSLGAELLTDMRTSVLMILLSRKSCIGNVDRALWKQDGWERQTTMLCSGSSLQNKTAVSCHILKLQVGPFFASAYSQPSSTVGGNKKSRMAVRLSHSYLL